MSSPITEQFEFNESDSDEKISSVKRESESNRSDEFVDCDNYLVDKQPKKDEEKQQHLAKVRKSKSDFVDVSIQQPINKNMFINYGRQLFCLLIVFITVYATFQNMPHNVSRIPEPRPFFPAGSFVRDYPNGELSTVQNQVTLSDLSFVMFYAPWSAQSQHARAAFDFVAKLFYNEATFSAINCWQPGGECKQQYAKVMSWPVLMAYNQNNVAIPYNGRWTEAALTRFVKSLVNPLHRINSADDLLSLIYNHDAVVVAFIDMRKSSTFYNIFLQAAVKWLERDPYRDVAFAVSTGRTMEEIDVDREPSIRLFLWNDTIEYDNNVWKPSLLMKWIETNLRQVTQWLSPSGAKSAEFRPFLDRGPVLLLFTPRNLYEETNDAYAMLRQVGYEYFNCQRDEWQTEMARTYIHHERRKNNFEYQKAKVECGKLFQMNPALDNEKCASLGKRHFTNLVNSSKFHQRNDDTIGGRVHDFCEAKSTYRMINDDCSDDTSSLLSSIRSQSTKSSKVKITSELDNENDIRSAENIAKIYKAMKCKLVNLSKSIRSKLFHEHLDKLSTNESQKSFDKISGLACRSNRTLSILAMDSFTYELVAERLGIHLDQMDKQTAVAIIDRENESTYVFDGKLSTRRLIDFVHDFSHNKLNRHLRHSANLTHAHHFDDGKCHTDEYYDPRSVKNWQSFGQSLRPVSLRELSSLEFTDFVFKQNKTVAVLFHSTQCAFCTIFAATLLTISRILGDVPNLEFVRIDSDKNDLPWQFTMDTLPTFIIFNGYRKEESRKFPSTTPVTVKNVLGFILSNLNRTNRLSAMIAMLRHSATRRSSLDNDIKVLHREIEENIKYNLNVWRHRPQRRNYVLRRIQALKTLYLSLYRFKRSQSDFIKLNQLVKNVLNVWTKDEI